MRHAPIAACLLALSLALAACSRTTAPDGPDGGAAQETAMLLSLVSPAGEPLVVPLAARVGRLEIGTVTVANDADELLVTLETGAPWAMALTQIEVAAQFAQFPLRRRGDPRLRRFEHQATHDPAATRVEYGVSLAEGGFAAGDTLLICAHARAVWIDGQGRARRKVSAWGIDEPFPGSRAGQYFAYVVQPQSPSGGCRLTLLWPNGGESICEGASATIAWESSGECVDAVRLELLREGLPCALLAEGAPNTGSFVWEDPQRSDWETDGYTLQISAVEGDGADASDAAFAIDQCGGPE